MGAITGAAVGAAVLLLDQGQMDEVLSGFAAWRPGLIIVAGLAWASVDAKPATQNMAAIVVSQALRMAGPP
jgi:hypothetical protein